MKEISYVFLDIILHGSNLGELNRMNLESRTISLGDKKNYIIPKNLDGKYND